MIEVSQASRWYGSVIGVNDVTFKLGPGITALLGQNGAGKSTLMRLITGQMRPTTGEVKVSGQTPFGNPYVMKRLGFCPDVDSFPEHLSGREFVYRMARLGGLNASQGKTRTEELLNWVGMSERANGALKGYSKGMRQRIKLATALLNDPDVLLLDEPLNGLDPVGRREFMAVLGQLSQAGKCILVSSHILFEVEAMTSSMLLMHKGRLLAAGTLQTIRDLIDQHPHRIRLVVSDPRAAASYLAQLESVTSLSLGPEPNELEVRTQNADRFYTAISEMQANHGIDVLQLDSPDNSLEAVFGYLVEA